MKRHITITAMIVVTLLASCNQSPQEKAEALVADALKTMLYVPESYEPVATLIDSAFAASSSPYYLDRLAEIISLTTEIEEVKQDVSSSKSSMLMYKRGSQYSEYQRNEYKESKAEHERHAARLDKLTTQMDGLRAKLDSMTTDGLREFVGYKVYHRYRANGRFDLMTFMSDMIFLVDKDMTYVMAAYDVDDPVYDEFTEAISE